MTSNKDQQSESAPAEDLSALQQTTAGERKRAFGILFFCLLCLGMGQSLFFAVLPPVARDLGLTEVQVGAIFSLSALLWVVTSPFWGRTSDVWGRKPIMLIGLCGFGTSTIGFAVFIWMGMQGMIGLALLFPLLVGVRAIFGAFGSGTMPASQAYVADRTTRAERASGVATIGAAFGMGTVIGPGVAAALIVFGLLAPFFVVGSLAFASAIAIWVLLPERTRPRERQDKKNRLKIKDSRVWPFLIVGVLMAMGQSIVVQVSAFYFQDTLSLSVEDAAQMVGVGMMAMAMSTLFAQLVLIQRMNLSVQTMLRSGTLIMIVAFGLMITGGNYATLVMALVASGLGFGLLRPGLSAAASLSVRPDEQGSIAGYIGSTAAMGHVVNPFVALPLYQIMPQAPFILAACLMVVMGVFILLHPLVSSVRAGYDDDEDDHDGDVVPKG
ncbi:MFS transporter [Pyruvatibacter sp.]|uniref:MFS transporter n=1 Tax=Pyruvatibacter sp. TaxID=1981328 RepID=UPI0032644759